MRIRVGHYSSETVGEQQLIIPARDGNDQFYLPDPETGPEGRLVEDP